MKMNVHPLRLLLGIMINTDADETFFLGDSLSLEDKHTYLCSHVFVGLTDLNSGYDSSLIAHFSPEEFETVAARCERLNICIYGVEIFVNKTEFLDCVISPEAGFGWVRRLIEEYRGRPDIAFCASYGLTS